jgi:RNA polymerase sigma factor for flagellar operon FliA
MSAYLPACDEPAAAEAPVRTKALRQRYQSAAPGSPAEDELIRNYLPLVKTMAGRMAMTLPSHVDINDLYSSGLVGLLNAVRNFDPSSGTAFGTYARLRIRGAILDELRRMDWVPRSVHSKARHVQSVIQELEQKLGELPTETDIARALKISVTEYRQLLDEIRPATFVCLDSAQSAENPDGPTQYECIPDHTQENPVDGASRREMTRLIAERLEELPEMQRKVLALYYFEGLRLREIAEAYGLTESRICQIHAQAILSIKVYLKKFEAASD